MKTKIMMSMLSIALIAALIGGATLAYFSDSDQATPVTMAAGTLTVDLDVSEAQAVATTDAQEITNLNPGDQWEWDIKIDNTGTKKFQFGIYAFWKDTIGQMNTDLGAAMQENIKVKGYGTGKLTDALLFDIYVGDETTPWREDVSLAGMPGYYYGFVEANGQPLILDAGADLDLRLVAKFPTGAENEYQGSKLEFVIGVLASQATNGAPAPEFDPELLNPFKVVEPKE